MRKRVKKLAENEFKWLYFYLKNVFYHCLIKILVANTKNDENAKLVEKQKVYVTPPRF